jgi:hypothetical protein
LTPAASLALKLIVTPLLVAAASLAGRRWGSAVGGWLVGIPFTSGPIAFFLAVDHGPRFASNASAGIMAGTASQAAFALAYGWIALRSGWGASLLAGTIAFGLASVVLDVTSLPLLVYFVVVAAVLAVALALMPRRSRPLDDRLDFPRWDLPARMIVATTFVVVLTGIAPLLGARLAGLLSPFPLYATVLAVFAHRLEGAAPAISVLRGLLLGLFAFAAFFCVLSLTLIAQPIGIAFAAAIVVCLAVQGASLFAGRRLGIA